MPHYKPIKKNEGLNESERYLSNLCEKTFLSLWSYPSVFYKPGKELCDVLVFFQNKILIISDKNCAFNTSENITLAWKRWFKTSIKKSAKQLWGAERKIQNNKCNVYLDNKCTKSLPITIPKNPEIHLMAVTQGISEHISNHFQDESASFMISTSLSPMEECVIPFTIGDLDPQKSFVHIIDDYTLENMLSELDTPKELFQYLDKKEELFRSDSRLIIPGEEELIADYVTNIDHSTGMHSFSFLHKLDPYGNLFRDCERWK